MESDLHSLKTTSTDTSSAKRQLRRQSLERRAALDVAEYHRESWRICEHLLSAGEVRSGGTILAYWPLVARREVDIRPVIRTLFRTGRRVALPVLIETVAGQAPVDMEARTFEGDRSLRRGHWGLLEPRSGRPVRRHELDVVIVPALATDRSGNRLGYGKGFYDRYLAHVDAFTIGVVFETDCCARLPCSRHDIGLRAIVTGSGLYRSGASAT